MRTRWQNLSHAFAVYRHSRSSSVAADRWEVGTHEAKLGTRRSCGFHHCRPADVRNDHGRGAAQPGTGVRGPSAAAQRLGLQQVPKDVGAAPNAGSALSSPAKGANPLIALLPDPSRVDYAYWKAVVGGREGARGAESATRRAQPPGRPRGSAAARRRAGARSITGGNDTRRHRAVHPAVRQRRRQAPGRADPRDAGRGHAAGTVRTGARRQRSIPRAGAIRLTVGSSARRPRGRSATVPMVRPGTAMATSTSTSCRRESRSDVRGRHRHRRSSTPRLRGRGVGRGRQAARAQRRRRSEPRQPVVFTIPRERRLLRLGRGVPVRASEGPVRFRQRRRVPAAKGRTR